MEKNKQPTGRRQIVFRLCLMLMALVVMVVSFTYSWLYFGREADVSDIEMNVEETYNLLVSSGDGVWSKKLELDFPENFSLKAVAGNGNSFYSPIRELQKTGSGEGFNRFGYVTTGYSPISVSELENSVFSFDFAFRIEGDFELFLAENSKALPSENAPVSHYSEDVSTGAVVGAVRLAFFREIDGEYELAAVWIPDVTTELSETDGVYAVSQSEPENVKFVTDGAEGMLPEDCEYIIETNGQASGCAEHNGITYIWGPISEVEQSVSIGHLEKDVDNNFRLMVWIDGNDRECRNALLEGIVSLKMNFVAGVSTEVTE